MTARLVFDPLPATLADGVAAERARARWAPRWEAACEAACAEVGQPAVEQAVEALADAWPRLVEALPAASVAAEGVDLRWPGDGCWHLPPGRVPRQPRAQLEAALSAWVRDVLLPSLPRDAALGPVLDAVERLGPRALEPWIERCELERQLALLTPPLTVAFRLHPEAVSAGSAAEGGVVASERLDPEARERLWVGCPDRDALLRGVFVRGDNLAALGLFQRRFAGRVQCAYLDPPFNTGSAAFAYDDRRGRAAWLGFIDDRLERLTPLLRPDATLYAHIDYAEKERLRLLLDRRLHYVTEIIWRIGWLSGFKTRAKKFIRNHDTIYQYGACPKPLFRKRYLPYPEGYVRRDGKPPTGKGYPLEDTWNCSPLDRLDSILIKSFSREKVGQGNLTQKNEALLERLWDASSAPDDWVLDPFCGSGTGPAVAHKTGRRWLAVEAGAEPAQVALARLERVVAGDDRYGVTGAAGWSGGGGFALVDLVDPADLRAALDAPDDDPQALRLRWDGERLRWSSHEVPDPFACTLAGSGVAVDLPEWTAWSLGLHVKRAERVGEAWVLAGRDPAGGRVLTVWRRLGAASAAGLAAVLERFLRGIEGEGGRIFVHGAPGREAAAERYPAWSVAPTPAALEAGLTRPASGV